MKSQTEYQSLRSMNKWDPLVFEGELWSTTMKHCKVWEVTCAEQYDPLLHSVQSKGKWFQMKEDRAAKAQCL